MSPQRPVFLNLAQIQIIAPLLTRAWVGLRDVTLDYVNPLAAQPACCSPIASSRTAATTPPANALKT